MIRLALDQHKESHMARNIPASKAKQGRWGSQVLLVLIAGLALAGLVWLGLEFYGESIDSRSTGEPGAVKQR
jgi:hypothetical protein